MEQLKNSGMILIMSCTAAQKSGDLSCSEPSIISNADGFGMVTQLFSQQSRRRLLSDTKDGDYTCFKPPAAANTNADKPTVNDITRACFKKDLFTTGPLANRCIITNLEIVPNSYVDSYPVITQDYDVFNPYTKPSVGGILRVKVFDCDTNSEIKIANQTADAIKVELVGGDDCISFDESSNSFHATGVVSKSTKEMTVYETNPEKFAAKNVTTCHSNHIGLFMVVNSEASQGLGSSQLIYSMVNVLILGMLFVMREFYN